MLQTVFVVVGVGLLHGLFFMPLALCIAPQGTICFKDSLLKYGKRRRFSRENDVGKGENSDVVTAAAKSQQITPLFVD